MTGAHRELRRWLGPLGDLLVAQLQLRLQVLPRRPVPPNSSCRSSTKANSEAGHGGTTSSLSTEETEAG